MISECSEEDLSKVRASAREDHVATLRDQTVQSEDDEEENEEVEDDGEEGQGLEEVAGHGTPNDVAGALELSECPTMRKSWLYRFQQNAETTVTSKV